MPRKKKSTRPQPQKGQVHGERGQQEQAVQEVAQAARSALRGVEPPMPQVVPLDAPTQRPDEPITSGMATGPGVGPEALRPLSLSEAEQFDIQLRALYHAFPNEDLLGLIEHHQRRLPPPSAPLA